MVVDGGGSFDGGTWVTLPSLPRPQQECAVAALNGAPGVISARYAGEYGGGDEANNDLVLKNLDGIADRAARFVCVIAIARDGRLLRHFRGTVEGQIAQKREGANGFGYDPLFYYPPFGCTFGEADTARKHEVSHRAQAFRQLIAWWASIAASTGEDTR